MDFGSIVLSRKVVVVVVVTAFPPSSSAISSAIICGYLTVIIVTHILYLGFIAVVIQEYRKAATATIEISSMC